MPFPYNAIVSLLVMTEITDCIRIWTRGEDITVVGDDSMVLGTFRFEKHPIADPSSFRITQDSIKSIPSQQLSIRNDIQFLVDWLAWTKLCLGLMLFSTTLSREPLVRICASLSMTLGLMCYFTSPIQSSFHNLYQKGEFTSSNTITPESWDFTILVYVGMFAGATLFEIHHAWNLRQQQQNQYEGGQMDLDAASAKSTTSSSKQLKQQSGTANRSNSPKRGSDRTIMDKIGELKSLTRSGSFGNLVDRVNYFDRNRRNAAGGGGRSKSPFNKHSPRNASMTSPYGSGGSNKGFGGGSGGWRDEYDDSNSPRRYRQRQQPQQQQPILYGGANGYNADRVFKPR